jgi:hypothetical protein
LLRYALPKRYELPCQKKRFFAKCAAPKLSGCRGHEENIVAGLASNAAIEHTGAFEPGKLNNNPKPDPVKPLIRINAKTRIATKSDGTRIPVVDAKFNVLVQPNQDDIKNGIPGDHANCMYCLACRRQFDSELVWVTRSLAYVELKVKGGRSVLNRFLLSSPAKENVAEFDKKSAELTPEAVVFSAPAGARTLDAKRNAWHQWEKKRRQGKAYVKGEAPKTDRKRIKHFGETLRNKATGKFQFQPHS